jgi:squalene-hopene/tetraprenyl-beta-curcumene cyclase
MRPVSRSLAVACLIAVGAHPLAARAASPDEIRAALAKGAAFLVETKQAADGSFSADVGPAVTALAVTALVRSGMPADAPPVQRGLAFLLSFRQPDGGIYAPGSPTANYETSIGLLALAACNTDGALDATIAAAADHVKNLQWDEGEGKSAADLAYGGAGYGKKSRPDLSNTQFMVEALRTVGTSENDPAIQRALAFVSRTQNLPGPHNTAPFADKNPDGGFYYTPAAGGESQAGTTPDGGLRSYGSMTYAGLKSMIYAGVTKDDPRVKAAVAWLEKHYTFEENPGMGDAGLFYYFHTAAKSLDVFGVESFASADGTKHAWRDELSTAIIARQREDGSWKNGNERWMEGETDLATAYALLALSACLPK